MFLGHFAVGLAGRRLTPAVSLAVWFVAVQLLDLLWPVFLLTRLEHVRIAAVGPDPFLRLDFSDYPISHSLIGAIGWGLLFGGGWLLLRRSRHAALLLFGGVVSHWVLDAIAHRPDMPVLPHGPYVGLGLWYWPALTIVVEIAMFAGGILLYVRAKQPTIAFWTLMIVLLALYLGSTFGPPPPDVTVLAQSALAGWLLVVWAWWADRGQVCESALRGQVCRRAPRSRTRHSRDTIRD